MLVWSCTTRVKAARLDIPRRRDNLHALDVIVDLGVGSCKMSCRACRDPATKRGELPRLEEKAQSQSAGLKLLLKVRTEHSGLNARGLRSVVDFQNLVEVFHVDREGTAITIVRGRVYSSDDARPAAVRYGCHAIVFAPAE